MISRAHSRLPQFTLAALSACAFALTASKAAHADWLSMDRLVSLAQSRAITVVEANAQVGVAQAAGVGARMSTLGNPYVELVANRSENYSIKTPPKTQISSQFWFPFDVAGQRSGRIEEANRFLEWRRMGMVNAKSLVLGETVDAYGQVLVSAARLEEAQHAEIAAQQEREIFTQRLKVGDSTVYDQKLAESELAKWTQTRAEILVRLSQSRSRLSQLSGVVPIDVPPNGTETRVPPLRYAWNESAIARATERSPLVQSLRSERGYWTAAQERAQRDKYPPMGLIVQVGQGDQAEPRIGAGVAWAFPVIRANQGEIARVEAERSRTANLETTQHFLVRSRIQSAVASYETLRDALTVSETSSIPAAQGVLEAAEQGFRAGKIEIIRVLIARRDLASAKFRRLDLLEAMWRSYSELATLTGGLP